MCIMEKVQKTEFKNGVSCYKLCLTTPLSHGKTSITNSLSFNNEAAECSDTPSKGFRFFFLSQRIAAGGPTFLCDNNYITVTTSNEVGCAIVSNCSSRVISFTAQSY